MHASAPCSTTSSRKCAARQALALQAALHVGHRQQDGVDRAGRDLGLELVERHDAATYLAARERWRIWSAEQTNGPRWPPSSSSSKRASGRVEGEPTPLDGGITNRNFRVRFGGERLRRCALCGKDTEVLGIDRGAERDRRRGARPSWASRRRWSRSSPTCRRLVTRFVAGRAADAGGAARARACWRRSPRRCAPPRRPAAADAVRRLPTSSSTSARRWRGGAVPDGLRRRRWRWRGASRRR